MPTAGRRRPRADLATAKVEALGLEFHALQPAAPAPDPSAAIWLTGR